MIDAQIDTLPCFKRTYENDPKLGLALSGGAAHGLAHIGLIKYLDELGIRPDYITGTSMGAIIGGLYAMGYNGEEIEKIAHDMRWYDILRDEIDFTSVTPSEKYYYDKYPLVLNLDDGAFLFPTGLLGTNKLDMVLNDLYAPANYINSFDSLPIPFKCFGVDIASGKVVTMEKGKLSSAIRASMAIPTVFPPKKIDDKYIVDGGLIRNFPVLDNRKMGADIVVGSYVGRERTNVESMNSMLDFLTESAFMMSISDSEKQLSMSDITLLPDVKGKGAFDFDDISFYIEEGYKAAKKNEAYFLMLKEFLGPESFREIEPLDKPDLFYLDSISIPNISLPLQKLVRSKLLFSDKDYVSFEKVERAINRVVATQYFESVNYDIDRVEGKDILTIYCKPFDNASIGINLNHFNSTLSSIIINGEKKNFLFPISTARVAIRLSQNFGIGGEYLIRAGFTDKNIIIGASAATQRYKMPFIVNGVTRKQGILWESHFTPFVMYEFNNYASLTGDLDIRRFSYRNEVISLIDITEYDFTKSTLGLTFEYNNLNYRYFATKGVHFKISANSSFYVSDQQELSIDTTDVFSLPETIDFIESELHFRHAIFLGNGLTLDYTFNIAYKSTNYLFDNNLIGGTMGDRRKMLPFIGFEDNEVQTGNHVYLRGVFRKKVQKNIYLSLIGNYILGNTAVFNYALPGTDNDLRIFGVGFEAGIDLPTGPLLLNFGYNGKSEDFKGQVSLGWRHIF